MNVDLPAPLSPSTQVTWPALTTVETSFSAMTLPKYRPMPRTSRSGGPLSGSFWPLVFSGLIPVPPPHGGGRRC